MLSIFQHIMELQQEIEEEFFSKRNVVGVAVGYKESNGVITDEPAMVVMVETKHPLLALSAQDVVPKEVKGVRTDVYEVGKLVAERALKAGITSVVFDRGGYLYHGRVKALADGAREGGLKF